MDTLKPVISLSTCFLQSRFPKDGYAMLTKAADMGFEYVELGHSTPISSLEGIFKALEEGVVKVSSLHNFCPVPPFASGAVPNLFSPSTKSEIESQQWRRHTLNTLELAKKTGAKAIVSHCGELGYFLFPPDRHIKKYLSDKKLSSVVEDKTLKKLASAFVKKSSKNIFARHYKFLLENLKSIKEDLEKADVFIGVENREGIAELPLDWTFKQLFDEIGNSPAIKVWHDLGHSKIKELKSLYKQEQLIEETSDKIAGWHFHDCDEEGRDHGALGDGKINFEALKKYFKPNEQIFTLEISARVKSASVVDSLKRMQDLLA